LQACRSEPTPDTIALHIVFPKTKIQNLLGKYVFLTDVRKTTVIDSVLVRGDTVVFNKKWDPAFIPFMVSVSMLDTFNGGSYQHLLGFANPYKAKFINSLFYLDKGITTIKTYFDGVPSAPWAILGSSQNEPLLKNIELQYPANDDIHRQAIMNKNMSIIRVYPYSLYLLTQLYTYKENFSSDDLKMLLSCFDKNVQKTAMFKSFDEYFINASTFDKAFPQSITLKDSNGAYQRIGNDSASYNLIVFWASWCGPCRREIPELKHLFNQYAQEGLAITSISIDGDKRHWQTALEQEKMPWPQLIAIDSSKSLIDLHYSIHAIPKKYLFNRKKQLIGTSENDYITPKFITALFNHKL
jgi:thiol-disulfide isomerase/thioredoxin